MIRAWVVLVLLATGSAAREPAPYSNPERSDACEAQAQTVSACPNIQAEPCEGYWTAYDACMMEE